MVFTFYNVKNDHTIQAVFERIDGVPYNIVINPTEHGEVIASPTSQYEGGIVQLTITPDSGYKLATFKTYPTVEVDESYRFTMPASNVLITATFELDTEPTPTPSTGIPLIFVKVGGAWKRVASVSVRQNGSWHNVAYTT